jgi:hypothetical protein
MGNGPVLKVSIVMGCSCIFVNFRGIELLSFEAKKDADCHGSGKVNSSVCFDFNVG